MDWQALYQLRKEVETLGAQAAELFYSPDQARDDSGKWGEGGGSAAKGENQNSSGNLKMS